MLHSVRLDSMKYFFLEKNKHNTITGLWVRALILIFYEKKTSYLYAIYFYFKEENFEHTCILELKRFNIEHVACENAFINIVVVVVDFKLSGGTQIIINYIDKLNHKFLHQSLF